MKLAITLAILLGIILGLAVPGIFIYLSTLPAETIKPTPTGTTTPNSKNTPVTFEFLTPEENTTVEKNFSLNVSTNSEFLAIASHGTFTTVTATNSAVTTNLVGRDGPNEITVFNPFTNTAITRHVFVTNLAPAGSSVTSGTVTDLTDTTIEIKANQNGILQFARKADTAYVELTETMTPLKNPLSLGDHVTIAHKNREAALVAITTNMEIPGAMKIISGNISKITTTSFDLVEKNTKETQTILTKGAKLSAMNKSYQTRVRTRLIASDIDSQVLAVLETSSSSSRLTHLLIIEKQN